MTAKCLTQAMDEGEEEDAMRRVLWSKGTSTGIMQDELQRQLLLRDSP